MVAQERAHAEPQGNCTQDKYPDAEANILAPSLPDKDCTTLSLRLTCLKRL